MKQYYLALLVVILPGILMAQVLLNGKVMDSKSDAPLDGATIFNSTRRIYKKASFEGKYSISARENDILIFSSAGYRSDTVSISEELLHSGFDIGLKALPVTLDTVDISGRSYAQDSLDRRSEYRNFYNKPLPKLAGGNTPAYGFGVSVSPFSFFSKKEKANRKLKKQLQYNEEQDYIDYYFSASYVHRLTALTGEELYLFMRSYRPKYDFVRNATQEDLFNYINESFKSFKEKPPAEINAPQ